MLPTLLSRSGAHLPAALCWLRLAGLVRSPNRHGAQQGRWTTDQETTPEQKHTDRQACLLTVTDDNGRWLTSLDWTRQKMNASLRIGAENKETSTHNFIIYIKDMSNSLQASIHIFHKSHVSYSRNLKVCYPAESILHLADHTRGAFPRVAGECSSLCVLSSLLVRGRIASPARSLPSQWCERHLPTVLLEEGGDIEAGRALDRLVKGVWLTRSLFSIPCRRPSDPDLLRSNQAQRPSAAWSIVGVPSAIRVPS
jgi:hypothetical protein